MSDVIYSPLGSNVEVFTTTGTRKAFFQSGSGDYLGCKFVLTEKGCESVTLFFAKYAAIDKRDVIKIKIFDSTEYFFTGVIRKIPLDGSTKAEYNYSGFGFTDYFIRLNTQSQTYSATTVRAVVLDLVDTIIVPNSPITKNLSKIDALNISVASITFKYVTINDALDILKKIANSDGNDYRVGVDSSGDFYFKARDTSTIAVLQVGKEGDYGIEAYQPKNGKDPVSRLYVLKNDGTFYGTYTSSEDIDIFEKKLTGPDIADADLDKWADGQLAILEEVTKEANIDWQILRSDPFLIEADGNLRIFSAVPPASGEVQVQNYGEGAYGSGPYGGYAYTGLEVDDTLKIKKVSYTINDKQATMKIQLGNIPPELDREILLVNKKIEDLKISLGR